MSEKTFRSSPYMTPDSLRQKLHLDQAFYEMHTKKYFGREDINGLQYVGTVENFGSEMLLESRKMKMLRPPLSAIMTNSYMGHYFELKYADEINTYRQMNMVVGVLRKGALLSNNPDYSFVGREARVVFRNVKRTRMLRSRFDSDENVVNRIYYETTTPPVLVYKRGTNIGEYPLIATDGSGDTVYYFGITINSLSSLHGLIDGELTDEEYIRTFIDPELSTEDTLYTIPLEESMTEIPFIWMCFPSFNTLPKLDLESNYDALGQPLLEIGTNGHHQSYLYPMAYGRDNFPEVEESEVSTLRGWSVRVYARGDMFVESSPDTNFNTAIRKIQFLYGPKLRYDAQYTEEVMHSINATRPVVVWEINVPDDEFLRITLTDYDQFAWSKDQIKWRFRRARQGEWDYDGTLFMNPMYAYLYDIDTFFRYNSIIGLLSNHDDQQLVSIKTMYHLFEVIFNQDYFDMYDGLIENAVTGVHIDYTSDYSDNGVDKKNGTIYEMGDFGGLPTYYINYQTRNVHRSRVELYAIRDDINNVNQTPMERQTAALLVDGGIPQFENESVQMDLESVIQYDSMRRFITTGESISAYNSLSDLCLIKGRRIGDVSSPKYQNNTKQLIYHGARYFSLSVTGLSPENYSRVYAITNDPVYYENNESCGKPKSPRTLARICDIPTEYGQLVHLKGVSPTFVADPYYIHSDCDYTMDDQDRIWNLNSVDHYVHGLTAGKNTFVFDADTDLDVALSTLYLETAYSRMTNLNQYMDMRRACKTSLTPGDYEDVPYHWEIVNGGDYYRNGSEFTFFIGGIATKGAVIGFQDPNTYGPAEDYINAYDENRMIHVANLTPRDQEYTTTTSRYSGSGLTIHVDIDSDVWNALQPTMDCMLDQLYTFKKDAEGNIWVWFYRNDTWEQGTQLTGVPVHESIYDDETTRDLRKTVPAMVHNILKRRMYRTIDGDLYVYREALSTIPIDPMIDDVDDAEVDLSQSISDYGLNYQDSYYTLTNGVDSHAHVNVYQSTNPGGDDEVIMFPKNHYATEYEHFSKTNEFLLGRDHEQTILQIYSPYTSKIVEASTIGPDLVKQDYERDITFMDLDPGLVDFTIGTGVLNKNVYQYDGYQIPLKQRMLEPILYSDDVTLLLDYIYDQYGECDPIRYRDTEFAYTADMLKQYIVENIQYIPAYQTSTNSIASPVSKLRNKGETVVENQNGIHVAVGAQPTGAYLEIGTEIFNPHMKTDTGLRLESQPLYVFRIDEEIGQLDGFHLMDDINDIDLSPYTLLIYKRDMYLFDQTEDTWKKVIRNKEG